MGFIIGSGTSGATWSPVTDLQYDGSLVQRVGFGVGAEVQEVWNRGADRALQAGDFNVAYSHSGGTSGTILTPTWAVYVTFIAIGGGAGGSSGGWFNRGKPGAHGHIQATTWATTPNRKFNVTFGKGGAAGNNKNGEATIITVNDRDWRLTADGGTGTVNTDADTKWVYTTSGVTFDVTKAIPSATLGWGFGGAAGNNNSAGGAGWNGLVLYHFSPF